jgi:hypothetical protein
MVVAVAAVVDGIFLVVLDKIGQRSMVAHQIVM